MHCASCRVELQADDRFCGECGAPVAPPAAPVPKRGFDTRVVIGLAVFWLAGLALVAFLVLRSRAPRPDQPAVAQGQPAPTAVPTEPPAPSPTPATGGLPVGEAEVAAAMKALADRIAREQGAEGDGRLVLTTSDGRTVREGEMLQITGDETASGWFVVKTATPLLHDPRPGSETLLTLPRGLRVRVTGSVGDYLEVRSVQGRNGYALNAALVEESAGR